MRPLPKLFTLALVLAPFALALTPAPTTAAVGCDAAIGDPLATEAGHDHRRPEDHRLATDNMRLVGKLDLPPQWDGVTFGPPVIEGPVVEEDEAVVMAAARASTLAAGGARFGEVDAWGPYVAVAAISSPIGVWIVDATDPARPVVVSRWNGPMSGYVTDVKWASNGDAIYASVQSGSQAGMFLVDASDKREPVTSDFASVANGVHMMAVHAVAPSSGLDLVLGATGYSNGVAPRYATSGLPEKRFIPLPQMQGYTAHDVWVDEDPIAGRLLMYVANSYSGVAIVDVTIPALPVKLGSWPGSGEYMHTVRAQVIDGMRVIFASPEFFFGTSGRVAAFYALDATDFADIRVMGSWTNPGGHRAGDLTLSTHNFQIVGTTAYLAHYHGGVWVLDVADPANMVARAYYLPHDHTFAGANDSWPPFSMVPAVWDVVLKDGYMLLGDITGGLYVTHYACDETGPTGPTSSG